MNRIPRINDIVRHGDDIGTVIAKSGDEFSFVEFPTYVDWISNDELVTFEIPHCPNCGTPMIRMFRQEDDDIRLAWWECVDCNEKSEVERWH